MLFILSCECEFDTSGSWNLWVLVLIDYSVIVVVVAYVAVIAVVQVVVR